MSQVGLRNSTLRKQLGDDLSLYILVNVVREVIHHDHVHTLDVVT